MDFFIWCSVKGLARGILILISYDIACQWSTNMEDRLYNAMPADLQPERDAFQYKFVIPRFHAPVHVEKCRLLYSFSTTECTGTTDGETPERLWRYLDSIAPMLREMGPGSRLDRLNDYMGDWNWKKIVSMRTCFILSLVPF